MTTMPTTTTRTRDRLVTIGVGREGILLVGLHGSRLSGCNSNNNNNEKCYIIRQKAWSALAASSMVRGVRPPTAMTL